MNYERLTNEELNTYPYPNLMAELIESGYSICTLGEHMGLNGRREQDDPEMWDKLTGKKEILASEAFGLARLFGVSFEYLFSHELRVFNGETAAYWRWFDRNECNRKEFERSKQIREIEDELRRKPYLLEFVKSVATLSDEQIDKLIELMEKQKTA